MAYEWLPENITDYLAKYSCTFVEWEGWYSRAAYGEDERDFTPVGLVNHHTAGTNDYDPARLLTKCNFYISPVGVTYLLAAGYQADTGMGDPNVLARVRNDQPPTAPQDARPSDRINGNPWFIDIEVGHWGDGSPIPEVQRDELIRVNAAVCDMYGWDPRTRLIGHKEWTRRKIDPFWSFNGSVDMMEDIRSDTVDLIESKRNGMPETQWHQMIDALFEGSDEFNGDPNYWKFGVPEDSPEWEDFWAAFVRAIT